LKLSDSFRSDRLFFDDR